ncbi:hypothetical protein [Cryobacterium fucosi]|uniref:Lipoprotein with Yx(FWY)xxD motif n=1 Tax=Cryobacterium fucosi TaxID=1259157 RepID=A0A4R9BF81_9MICO|nr:hypothetical protein [Cryobacterium fucosi]TFD82792.1 hypothetical protein E3T48_00950 [Cryobacterium fucosi]
MNRKLVITCAAVALGVLALAGCSAGGSTTSSGEATGSSSEPATPPAQPVLATASTSLGDIVVDGTGLTVYLFDKDTANSGTSVCEGDCLAKWPTVVATDPVPVVDGVTGTVGTITRTDGAKQVTLNGWPLYTFAGDTAAGTVAGQGVGGVWWALTPSGDKIGGPTG